MRDNSKNLGDVDAMEATNDSEVEKNVALIFGDKDQVEAKQNGKNNLSEKADSEDGGEDNESIEPDEPPKKKAGRGRPPKANKSPPKSPKKGVSKGRPKRGAVEDDEPEEYEVDEVVGMRVVRKKRQFLIRWKGFKADSDTWEAEDSLTCDAAIEAYLKDTPESSGSKKGPPSSPSKKQKTAESEDDKSDSSSSSEASSPPHSAPASVGSFNSASSSELSDELLPKRKRGSKQLLMKCVQKIQKQLEEAKKQRKSADKKILACMKEQAASQKEFRKELLKMFRKINK